MRSAYRIIGFSAAAGVYIAGCLLIVAVAAVALHWLVAAALFAVYCLIGGRFLNAVYSNDEPVEAYGAPEGLGNVVRLEGRR